MTNWLIWSRTCTAIDCLAVFSHETFRLLAMRSRNDSILGIALANEFICVTHQHQVQTDVVVWKVELRSDLSWLLSCVRSAGHAIGRAFPPPSSRLSLEEGSDLAEMEDGPRRALVWEALRRLGTETAASVRAVKASPTSPWLPRVVCPHLLFSYAFGGQRQHLSLPRVIGPTSSSWRAACQRSCCSVHPSEKRRTCRVSSPDSLAVGGAGQSQYLPVVEMRKKWLHVRSFLRLAESTSARQ